MLHIHRTGDVYIPRPVNSQLTRRGPVVCQYVDDRWSLTSDGGQYVLNNTHVIEFSGMKTLEVGLNLL